ncbi:MAG: ribosome silencing factor [Eubacteriales bacterium]|nr:ribosome silencing factor [Eubacteriales bacterium]
MLTNEIRETIGKVVEILADRKAEDIRVIDISEISVISDCFVIAHANNPNQLRALVETVEEKLEASGIVHHQMEGNFKSGWVLIDYGDFILHIFDRENRLFYNLERMWRDGKEIDVRAWTGGVA